MKAAVRLLFILALVAPSFASAQTPPPAPTCTLKASAATVAPNTKVRLDWTSKNASAGYLNEVGPIPSAGFAYVVPGKNTTYAASFTGPGGSIVCRVGVAVSAPATGGGGGTVNTGGTVTNPPVTTPNTSAPTTQTGLTSPTGNGFVGGIVPAECRGKSTIANCDLCSLAQMIQNLSNFMLGLSVPAAAILFAIAGIRLFGAGGVPERIKDAKKIFKTVLIGFLIIVSVWALVNTAMNMLMKGGDLGQWNWSTLDCRVYRAARLYNMSIKDYLNTSLPTLSGYTNVAPILSGGSAFGTQCPYGGSMSVTEGGNVCTTGAGQSYPAQTGTPPAGCSVGGELTAEGFCVRADGLVYTPSTGSSASVNGGTTGSGTTGAGVGSAPLTSSQYESLLNSCEEQGNEQACGILDAYENNTSGGRITLTDTQKDALQEMCKEDGDQEMCGLLKVSTGPALSQAAIAGVRKWSDQISQACANTSMSDCAVVQAIMSQESRGNCNQVSSAGAVGCMQLMPTTACGIDSSIPGCSTCNDFSYNKGAQCAEVKQFLLTNNERNIQLGTQELTRLYARYNGDLTLTAAGYNGGDGANRPSSSCPGQTVWQCTLNPKYAETRDYVIKVNGYYSALR